jgi:hypothetical protein
MATKKSSTSATAGKYQKLFEVTPYLVPSQFELENFSSSSNSVSFPRRTIEVVNRIRELNSLVTTTEYEQKSKEANILALTTWLDNYDVEKLAKEVSSWEEKEMNYWIDTLGKTAAIEIIANGAISKATVEKMTMLPEEGYVKATQLCVKLANAIKSATVKAEEAIGIKHEPLAPVPAEQGKVPTKPGFKLKRQ